MKTILKKHARKPMRVFLKLIWSPLNEVIAVMQHLSNKNVVYNDYYPEISEVM